MSEAQTVRDEDWYGEDLGAAHHTGVTFTDVDLTEATTSGATFEGCTFHNCRFNCTTHDGSAFVGCEFRPFQRSLGLLAGRLGSLR